MTAPPRVLALPGGEPILHHGPRDGPQLLVLQPLFEEMNRCRALVAALCRGLAGRGIGCWLPDLPGAGESVRALGTVAWGDWTACVADAATLIARETGIAPASVAVRGGALLDGGFARRWRLSPVAGASLWTDLRRAGLTGEAFAGYDVPDGLAAALRDAVCAGGARTLRLVGDDRPCDARIEGAAPWRRSEPACERGLADGLVDDVAGFATLPGGSARIPREVRDTPEGDRVGAASTGRRLAWRGGCALSFDGPADARRGWVFVTGGTQTRIGPHRLYERLARRLAERGDAVVRLDRPGVGDSPGIDAGFDDGAPIATAAAALRAAFPAIRDLSGFGLCDGAAALALHGAAAGIDRLVLANPWVVEPRDDLPAPAAIRGHYRDRLADPHAWARLFTGRVDLRGLARGLARSAAPSRSALAERVAAGVAAGTRVVLAADDGTARAFDAAWSALAHPPAIEVSRVASASHSFADARAFEALAVALNGGQAAVETRPAIPRS